MHGGTGNKKELRKMSGPVAERKRLVRVTAGNIRNSHIYITGHLDFFPKDCLGDSRRNKNGTGKSIHIHFAGLNETIETDIARDAKTGKPRRFCRKRAWSASSSPSIASNRATQSRRANTLYVAIP